MRTDYIVAYDVSTETKEGRRRLHQVAKACVGYGQRVQHSVFECALTEVSFEKLKAKLLDIIDPDEDSLRIYKLRGARSDYLESHGRDTYVDFSKDTLLV